MYLFVYVRSGCCTFTAHKVITYRSGTLRTGAFWQYVLLQVSCFALISYISAHHVSDVYWIDTALYLATVTSAAILSFILGRLVIFRPAG